MQALCRSPIHSAVKFIVVVALCNLGAKAHCVKICLVKQNKKVSTSLLWGQHQLKAFSCCIYIHNACWKSITLLVLSFPWQMRSRMHIHVSSHHELRWIGRLATFMSATLLRAFCSLMYMQQYINAIMVGLQKSSIMLLPFNVDHHQQPILKFHAQIWGSRKKQCTQSTKLQVMPGKAR